MAPVAVLLSLLTTVSSARMRTEHMDTAQPSELAYLPQELRSHNDAQDLLLLQDYKGGPTPSPKIISVSGAKNEPKN